MYHPAQFVFCNKSDIEIGPQNNVKNVEIKYNMWSTVRVVESKVLTLKIKPKTT